MKPTYIGSGAVAFAAILWSLDGLLRRALFDLPPSVIVFWEHLFGLIILIPLIIIGWKGFLKFSRKQWFALGAVAFLSGALGTIFYTGALGAVHFIPFSVVVLLQQLQPIFAITAAAILLKERISGRFIILAIFALIAAYFVSFPNLKVNFTTEGATLIAALLAIGAAASWGISTALSKYALNNTSTFHATAARFALTVFFALIVTFVLGKGGEIGNLTTSHLLYIVAITFSTGLVALFIYYFGLKRIPASRSTIIELVWPISAIFIGYIFLGESLTLTQWIGSIALVAIMLLVVREQTSPNMKAEETGALSPKFSDQTN
jgi:drug/metabolite transporter (DMT)-like permease